MTRREIIAEQIIKAWQRGEPTGLLMRELYRECGMTKDAIREAMKNNG